jgi:hypothetical protein
MATRLAVVFFGICMALASLFATPPSEWAAFGAISILVAMEELYTLSRSGRMAYFRDYFQVAETPEYPATVFDGDRTFVELLAAVAGGTIGIGLSGSTLDNRWPANLALLTCIFAAFFYLSVQGGSVESDYDDNNKHLVRVHANSVVTLLLTRNLVYWSFVYGLFYIVLEAG